MKPVEIKLYDIFRKDLNLSEEKAQNLVEAIHDAIDSKGKESVTKEYLHNELSELKVDIIKWVVILILGQTALLAALIKLFG